MLESKPRLLGIADLYAVDDARRKKEQEVEPLSKSEPVRKITPVVNPSLPLSKTELNPFKVNPFGKHYPYRKVNLLNCFQSDAPHIRFPYEILDHVLKDLKPAPRVVMERLYRLSAGWDSDECVVSLAKLSEHCQIEPTQIRKHLVALESRGFIQRLENVVGGRDLSLRGVRFRVLLPRIPLSKSEPNKETHIKETHTNTDALADAREKTAVGVGVSSRFTLEECRRFAESLHADGITNPGGYATKVHRSGEADDLIAKFLSPVEPAKKVDVSRCPDCYGTGFYEPGGAGKGVAKCKHERLLKVS